MKNINKKVNVWDKNIEVESNHYNWNQEPVVRTSSNKQSNAKLLHIDLFSGCGGFSTGFEQAGFTTEVAVDIHPPSLETLYLNHEHATTILGDIRKVTSVLIKENLKTVGIPTVITAGVPCQGFSLANRKRNSEDKRNFLFHEFIRIISELKPTAVVLENVSGLLSTNKGSFKRAIAKAISQLGYEIYTSLLNSLDYGVPQKRRRVFFIGVPKGTKWFFPPKTHGIGLENNYVTVEEAILGDLPELNANESSVNYKREPKNAFECYIRDGSPQILNHKAPKHPLETIKKIEQTLPGMPMYPKFNQRIRLHPKYPSPTQICGGIRPQFQLGHPTQSRGLTIRERARIQSFPDSYFFVGGITQSRVQTGNAVPPLLAKAIANQLANVLLGKEMTGELGDPLQKEFFNL